MQSVLPLFAQDNGDAAAGAVGAICGLFGFVLWLAVILAVVVGMWKIFDKAGKPGWASLIPIYNLYVLTEISGRDIIWFVLCFIPCINIVALVLIWMDVAKNFGKDPVYGLGLAFLSPIFIPLLGFSKAVYRPGKSK